MNSFLATFDTVLAGLRVLLFAGGAAVAVVAGLSYAARTRRISPFSAVARFVRGRVDPLLAPVERRVVRSGGQPASAPWWALAAVVIGGIIVLSILGFIRQQIALASYSATLGVGGLVALLVGWTFGLLRIALLVRVLSSWIPAIRNWPVVPWAFALTEWLIRPLRQFIPQMGPIDVSPIAAYFILWLLEGFVGSLLR